jgi:protocatechuate 3,4-dioxygenase beta subunit
MRTKPQSAGRILPIVRNDRESETRTPAAPLYVIPAAARDPFSAIPPLPAMREAEADLTRIGPGRPHASGKAITIQGRILDENSRAVRRTLIEVWNANTHGRYSHIIDATRNSMPLDPHFYGFGRLVTDDDGYYRLRTIKPGAYLARGDIDWWRPSHVHFSIAGGGVRLITQLYFPDEPLNLKDYIHMMIPENVRHRVVGRMVGEAGKEPVLQFDIVVRGQFQTPFEL